MSLDLTYQFADDLFAPDKANKITVEYSSSSASSYAPLIVFSMEQNGNANAMLSLDPSHENTAFDLYNTPDGFSGSVSFLAGGDSGSVDIYYAGWEKFDFETDGKVTPAVKIYDADSLDTFYWRVFVEKYFNDAEYCDFLAGVLTEKYGNTMGGYVCWLNELNAAAADAGLPVTSADKLAEAGMMLYSGNHYSLPEELISVNDITLGSGKLSFSMIRKLMFAPGERCESGSFGSAWNTVLDAVLVKGDHAVFKLTLPDGSEHLFTQDQDGWSSNEAGYTMVEHGTGYLVTAPDGISYKYDSAGKFRYMKNSDGETITAVYDADGVRLSQLLHADGSSLIFGYDDSGRIISITKDTETVLYSYDAGGNLQEVTLNGESLHRYEWNALGLLTSYSGTDQKNTVITYDEFHRPVFWGDTDKHTAVEYDGFKTIVTSSGNTFTMITDFNGRAVGIGDELGNICSCKYDQWGNLVEVTDENGSSISRTYDEKGRVISQTDPLGNKTLFTYDGNTVTRTDMYGNETDYILNDFNKPETIINADGSEFYITYDEQTQQPVNVTLSDGSSVDVVCDANGNILQLASDGYACAMTYDDANRLTSVTDALGNIQKYSYNAAGDMTSYTDANGNETIYNYSDSGKLLSITYADGTSFKYTYDSDGNLLSWSNRRGDELALSVDSSGNMQSVYCGGNEISFSYDEYGRLTGAGDMTFTCDINGNVTSQIFDDGREIHYTYDRHQRLTSVADELGNRTLYSFDKFGHLDTVTDENGDLIADYDYSDDGMLSKLTRGNGTFTVWNCNDDGLISRITHFGADKKVISFEEYEYNDTGLCVSKTTEDGVWQYSYDPNDRLIREVFTENSGTVTIDNSYTYDAVGNRTGITDIGGNVINYTYNNLNQIVSANGFQYVYDADGNLLEDEKRTYTWTKDNRVASETLKATGETWSYTYDAFGNRSSVTANGVKTVYTYDCNGNIIAEYVDGEQTRNYYHGLKMIGFEDNSEDGGDYYFNQDFLNSTIAVTDSIGVEVNNYFYDAFGNVITVSEGVANDYEFVGGYGHAGNASGTVYMKARNYDPDTGRWISADQSGLAGGGNLYEYCAGNPLYYVDQYGYAICPVHGNDELISGETGALVVGYGVVVVDSVLAAYNALPKALSGVGKAFKGANFLTAGITLVVDVIDIGAGAAKFGKKEALRRVITNAASFGGATLGATLGSFILPGVGTLVGGVMGAFLGSSLSRLAAEFFMPPNEDHWYEGCVCNYQTNLCPINANASIWRNVIRVDYDKRSWLGSNSIYLNSVLDMSEKEAYEWMLRAFRNVYGSTRDVDFGNVYTLVDLVDAVHPEISIYVEWMNKSDSMYSSFSIDDPETGLGPFLDRYGACTLVLRNRNGEMTEVNAFAMRGKKFSPDSTRGLYHILITDCSNDVDNFEVYQVEYDETYGMYFLWNFRGSYDWYLSNAYTLIVAGKDLNNDGKFDDYQGYDVVKWLHEQPVCAERSRLENCIAYVDEYLEESSLIRNTSLQVNGGGRLSDVFVDKGCSVTLEENSILRGTINLLGNMVVNGPVDAEGAVINVLFEKGRDINKFAIVGVENLKGAEIIVNFSENLAINQYKLFSGAKDFVSVKVNSTEFPRTQPHTLGIGSAETQPHERSAFSIMMGSRSVSLKRDGEDIYCNLYQTSAELTKSPLGYKAWWGGNGIQECFVEFSKDNFATSVRVKMNVRQLDILSAQYDCQWRMQPVGSGDWIIGNELVGSSEWRSYIQSNRDGNFDIFFAYPKTKLVWERFYQASHQGIYKGWKGTGESVVLNNRNKLKTRFDGTVKDPNLLILTDDKNGDAIFLDDMYDEYNRDSAKLAHIYEIRAGAGDDIIDMTSQRFTYAGTGTKFYGGAGDDIIWANRGENRIFGDAGNDRLVGADGNDIIVGGAGNDSMHGGGGKDIFCFGGNWGSDTIEQLDGGTVTLWFESGSLEHWDEKNKTYEYGDNKVVINGSPKAIRLLFGDNGTSTWDDLKASGCFMEAASENIFEDQSKGYLA